MSGMSRYNGGGYLPLELALPKMSDALAIRCRDIMSWEGRPEPSYSEKMQAEAADALAQVDRLMKGPSLAHFEAWVTPIIAGARNAKSDEAMGPWFDAVMLTVEDVPASAFNLKTQRSALRSITFFPATGDIYAAVEDERTRLIEIRTALQRIAMAPTTEERR